MAFDDDKKTEKLLKELVKNRLVPSNYNFEDSDNFWAEFRSLLDRPMSGGELREEWDRLWKAIPEEKHPKIFQHIRESWSLPCETSSDVQEAFFFRVIQANVRAIQKAGLEFMLPPLGKSEIESLENRWATTIPTYFRLFLQSVSAGFSSKTYCDINVYFPFEGCLSDWKTWRQLRESYPVKEMLIGYALEEFLLHPNKNKVLFEYIDDDEYLEYLKDPAFLREKYPVSQNVLDTMRSMVLVYCHCDVYHEDNSAFLITQGKLAGRVISCENLEHNYNIESVDLWLWNGWLYYTYIEAILWNIGIEDIDLDRYIETS